MDLRGLISKKERKKERIKGYVCLCLSACQQDNSESCGRLLVIFLEGCDV